MMSCRNDIYAVVTGDVVGSKKMSSAERVLLLRVLRRGHHLLQLHFKRSLASAIDVFRGDSWQFVLSKPEMSLRAALFLRAFLISQVKVRSVDTRFAIGIGPVEFLPSKATPTGDGEAFRRSGHALDRMPRSTRMGIDGPASIGSLDSATLDVMVRLVDALVRHWTPRQADVVCGALLGWKQERIASVWIKETVSQQAVAMHLERAEWNAVAAALTHFECQCTANFLHDARHLSAARE